MAKAMMIRDEMEGKEQNRRLFYSNCESKMYDSVRLLSSFMQKLISDDSFSTIH